MPTLAHTALRRFGYALFQAAGVPEDQARIVADHLVDANLVGHDSHGIIRMPRYARSLSRGGMQPVGDLKIVRESPATLVLDAERSLGIVVAHRAMQMATKRALTHTFGAVAVHRSGHIGRLGDFPPIAAEQDCIGILLLNGGGRFTAPFGGTGRRLPPHPMVLDITTSMAAGGKVDVYRARNQPLPEGWLIDPDGNPSTDPVAFREGKVAMLPLGGPAGHKGYGLSMMIDAIAGGLSWAGCSAEQPTRGGSGFLALAIKIESFIDPDDFKREVQTLIDWVKSSPTQPGTDRIYVPGEIEAETRRRREVDGVAVEEATWTELLEVAAELNVPSPETGGEAP